MPKQRVFTPEQKAKIVVEILQGANTISEIGARESISPNQLSNWKQEFVANAYRAFSIAKDEKATRQAECAAQARERELLATIGQLVIERDWLKKKSGRIASGRQGSND
jgi:putative transposase